MDTIICKNANLGMTNVIDLENNIIEQYHRFIKKSINPMLGFQSYDTAKRTLRGIEAMHMMHKVQIKAIQCVNSEVQFIYDIMSKAA